MTDFLSSTFKNTDLKKLSLAELNLLSDELRRYIIDVVSANGGHLAPSLGVVELTVALHRFLDLPKDKVVWDVGHQCYPHKILSGRYENFSTLRTYGGVSGFPKPGESPCDPYIAGHSSTSISVAAGLLTAARMQGSYDKVVAVIGDGALSGGMAYEALNHVGAMRLPLVIILNDNNMSISKNVGAMSEHLAQLRTSPLYRNKKKSSKEVIEKIPGIGMPISRFLENSTNSFKYFLSSSGIFFEEMGFTYLGPVNGHDIESLLQILALAHRTDKPVIIHALTHKGRGYLPAEQRPNVFHGTPPFDILTGKTHSDGKKTYTHYFSEKMLELAEKDKKVCAITAAMPSGTGLSEFAVKYPNRFFDVGIAEAHAVTYGGAMAAGGMKPVVAVYSSFLQRAYDQIIHDICIGNVPLTLAVDRAGLVGEDGETHQGLFDLAMLRQMPNMNILVPRDGRSLNEMLEFAVNLPAPAALRYHRGSVPFEVGEHKTPLALGKGETLADGKDIGILALGNCVKMALDARNYLADENISAAVADLRFAKPLDHELICDWAKKYRFISVIEEGVTAGGVGSAVLELLQSEGINTPVIICALPDKFIPQGKISLLLEEYGLTAPAIAKRLASFCKEEANG